MEKSKDFNYLFNDMPLYTKEIFYPFELVDNKCHINKKELERFCKFIYNNKLVAYCHKCKKEFPFNVTYEIRNRDYNSNTIELIDREGYLGYSIDITKGFFSGSKHPSELHGFRESISYIEYFFDCTNDINHQYIMLISVEINKDKFIVRKIGQNPSMLTIKGFDFDKYKKELMTLDAYEDYKKADLCFAEHFFVGSFAYLRRIFEKMLNEYTNGQTLPDNHVSTKIKCAKDRFDPRIKDLLKNMYEILSVSIHELNENTSKEYYEYLKAIIDIQLEYVKTESDKQKQSYELSTVLNKIASELGKK